MNITVVVPTYNEAGNIAALTEALFALPLPGLRLLVVDDGSPDGTGRLADELAAARPGRMEVLHRQPPRGFGLSYKDGFRRALDEGAEVIVQMDADGSHAPNDVPRLVEKLGEFDVAVGSRYIPGGGIDERWGPARFALSRSANLLARTILGLKQHDTTSGFKAWRRAALQAVDPGRVRSGGFLFLEETAFLCRKLGLRVSEVPIYFAERTSGRSKMSFKVKMEAAAGLLALRRHHRKVRPVA